MTEIRAGFPSGPLALIIVLSSAMLALSACSPSLSPLYRDYERPGEGVPIEERVIAALSEAGWQTVDADVPNAITTEARTLSRWGIYRVTAELEVTPLGQNHVRVFVHPYRHFITGGKGKIPYVTPRLRSKLLGPLNEAFKSQGLTVVGTPVERDEEITER